jgi:outer membrane protein assembly factor BamB
MTLKQLFINALLLVFAAQVSAAEVLSNSVKSLKLVNTWALNIKKDTEYGSPRHEFSSPILIGNEIFVGSSDGSFAIVGKDDGSVRRYVEDAGGLETAPLYNKGVMYFGNNEGMIKAYSYRTGMYEWTYYTGFPVHSTPCLCSGILTVLSSNDVLYAFDPKTGKMLWSKKRDFPAKRPVVRGSSTPVCYNEAVYVGFSDGTLLGLNVYDGTQILEKNISSKGKFQDVDATAYINDGNIIIPSFDGALYCLNLSTGAIKWSVNDGSANSVIVESGQVYYTSNEGYLYNLDIKDGSIKWRKKIKGGVPSRPAIAGEYLIIGSSERGIEVYSKKDGTFITEFNSGTGVMSQPLVYNNNMIAVFSNGAVLYGFTLGRF